MTKIKILHGTTKTRHSQMNIFKYTFLNIYIHMFTIYIYLMYTCILTVYIYLLYIYTLTVYMYIFSKISVLFSHKSKKILPFVRVWLNLEGFMHSETSRERQILHHLRSRIWNNKTHQNKGQICGCLSEAGAIAGGTGWRWSNF